MNRMVAPVAGALLMAAALAGCSGPMAYGGIQKIDTTAHTVLLYTGNTYTFPATIDLSKFKVTDDVKIAYAIDPATKKNMATDISIY
jgi:hypothetical protein